MLVNIYAKNMSLLRKILFRIRNPVRQNGNICYGQDGEDLILDRYLNNQALGYYVDVGAHHPKRFSNTYLFYKRGWHGINIDAMPGSKSIFDRARSRDINIECGVAMESGLLAYYRFNEPALNTFDKAEALRKCKAPYHLVDVIEVKVERLDALLHKYLPQGQKIDFLSVDVEGFDEEVLRSNDWILFRPHFILVEVLRMNIFSMGECSIVKFLRSVGYVPVAKAYNTVFFQTSLY